MYKNILLFLGKNLYLSNPQYIAITRELEEYHKVFLYLHDPFTSVYDKNFLDKHYLLKYFDTFLDLKPLKLELKGKWKFYWKYKRILTKYLNKINPKVIISCSDMDLCDRVVSTWCKRKNIPFVILQPSFIDNTIPKKHGLREIAKYVIFNKILGIPKYRRQILFGNESQKTNLFLWSEYFIENPKRKNIFIIGNPVFDELFQNFSVERKIKNNILICTQTVDILFGKELLKQVNDIYVEAIKSKPDLTFYIKLHPREPSDKYDKVFDRNKLPNIKIVKNQNLYDLFKICDLQISVASFTSFEAAAMGLPIILVNPDDKFKFLDHYREEIDIRVTEIGEISKAIDIALSDEYWQEFVEKREKYFKKMLYSTNGYSSKCAANMIRNLVKK
jgi:UDP-N-acetylglucosamine:LPS N-acetylglucosamine transferase